MDDSNYIAKNRNSWNARTEHHYNSEFYNVAGFISGKTSLNTIELHMIGDVAGKKILHLQCHFGQDTLSLARLGAQVTGVDLSDKAINKAKELAKEIELDAAFICSDIYDLPNHLTEQFDIVFTSYGTIGWLPDLNKWGEIVSQFLKPNGTFIFVEFHPVVWMFDDDFQKVSYNYFNDGAIIETESGTYADRSADISGEYVMWNHAMSAVISSLLNNGLSLQLIQEFDYSPYNCFRHTVEFEPGKFRIKHMENKIPMVYAIAANKSNNGNV